MDSGAKPQQKFSLVSNIDIKIKPSELLILEHKTTEGQRTVLLRTVISRLYQILDIFNSKYFEAT